MRLAARAVPRRRNPPAAIHLLARHGTASNQLVPRNIQPTLSFELTTECFVPWVWWLDALFAFVAVWVHLEVRLEPPHPTTA